MFEKEAEEWVQKSVNENGHHFDSLIAQLEKQAYIAGAEFGYNKANEWHYVKDGDLPKDGRAVLSDKQLIICYVKVLNKWFSYPALKEVSTPIAWCEIPRFMEEC